MLKDGVLVPLQGGIKPGEGLTPWEGLQKLLSKQEQQDTADSSKPQGQQRAVSPRQPPKLLTKLPPTVQQEKHRKEQQEKGSRPRPGQQRLKAPQYRLEKGPESAEQLVERHVRKKHQQQRVQGRAGASNSGKQQQQQFGH